MQAMLEAFVWAAGVLVIALAIGAMLRGAGRLFVDMAETLFGVIIGDLVYDPEGVRRERSPAQPEQPEPTEPSFSEGDDLAGWSAIELVRLAQGLQLLRLMDETRFDFAKSDIEAGSLTLSEADGALTAADFGGETDGETGGATGGETDGATDGATGL